MSRCRDLLLMFPYGLSAVIQPMLDGCDDGARLRAVGISAIHTKCGGRQQRELVLVLDRYRCTCPHGAAARHASRQEI